MRLGEIDLTVKPQKAKYFLCKPDTTVISPLKDIYQDSIVEKLGEVNELTFSIPSKVERNHQLVDNPLIDKIKHRYLIKAIYNNKTEYFIFLEDNKSFDSTSENIQYKAFSRGYQLIDKSIRSYEAVSKNLTEIGTELLSETKWKIGFVDAEFDLMYRSFEVASQTVLGAIYDLAKKFDAVIFWDTVNLEINFYLPSKTGGNRGLRFKEGKYLESFNVNRTSLDAVTRLRVYGNEGLTFRRLTPTGANYLEDYSWYMYPFERDSNGNVLKSSDYMSDELCIALEEYTKALSDSQGQFDTLLDRLLSKQDEIQQEEQALSVLQSEYMQIRDEIDVLNKDNKSGTPAHADAVNRLNAKESEINDKISIIDTLDSELDGINDEIDTLRDSVNIETHLSDALLLELNDFIIEKDYVNETIVDDEDLLEEGIKQFNKSRVPKVTVSMNIVDFLSSIEAQNDWKKLRLGDIVYIESKSLRVGIEARILEITYDFENSSISITITNENELKDDYEKMIDTIYSASQTSTIVNMDKYKWDLAEQANDGISQILNNTWDATKRAIQGGYKQSINITDRGLVASSPDDPMKMLVLQNGVLALSNNGGINWDLAITPDGVFAQRLVGKIIMGNRLTIEDETGIIKMTGSKLTIYDKDENEKVILGQYDTNKYGLQVKDGAVDIRTSSIANRGIVFDASGIKAFNDNGAQTFGVDTQTGKVSIVGSLDIRSSHLSNRGVVIDSDGLRGYNATGTKIFEINTSTGDAMFAGRLSGASGTFSGSLSAASGTFTGTLSAVNGTFTGTLSGVSGTFVTLSSGTITGATINGSVFNSSGTYGTTTISGGGIVTKDVTRNNVAWLTYGMINLSKYNSYGTLDNDVYLSSTGLDLDRGHFDFNGDFSVTGSLDLSSATVTGLTVPYATSAGSSVNAINATNATNATNLNAYSGHSVRLSISENPKQLHVRVNGSPWGYINVL